MDNPENIYWAFPSSKSGDWQEHYYGMSLRDYFAAAAMASILGRIPAMPNKLIASQAYSMADAMLAERNKGEGGSDGNG